MGNSGPATLSAITQLWEKAGTLARRTKIEDAGSRVRQVREDLILTRITKMKLRKGSPAKYCYLIPGAYIMMVNLLQYTLDVTNMTINADGMVMPYGKVFNKTYPGPWIRRFFTPATLLSFG